MRKFSALLRPFLLSLIFVSIVCQSGDGLQGGCGAHKGVGTYDSPYNVEERENLGADWGCEDDLGCNCTKDYLNFIEIARQYSDPITEEELYQQIKQIEEGQVPLLSDPIPEGQLRDTLVDIMNIRFLRNGINERLLRVTTIRKNETAEYYERELLFEDPYVGTFKGILLMPKSGGPFPGIVAVHGHLDNARLYMENYHGKEFPSHGYAILMLTMRSMCLNASEDLITRSLLLNGFTFMGIRVYETLLGLKYLRYLPNVDDDRIGLIGHSGGSIASNLTIRTELGFRAYVSDYTGCYLNISEDGLFVDETTPELWPYHLLINDFSTCPTPVMQVEYGYDDQMDEIFKFFDKHLKD